MFSFLLADHKLSIDLIGSAQVTGIASNAWGQWWFKMILDEILYLKYLHR